MESTFCFSRCKDPRLLIIGENGRGKCRNLPRKGAFIARKVVGGQSEKVVLARFEGMELKPSLRSHINRMFIMARQCTPMDSVPGNIRFRIEPPPQVQNIPARVNRNELHRGRGWKIDRCGNCPFRVGTFFPAMVVRSHLKGIGGVIDKILDGIREDWADVYFF